MVTSLKSSIQALCGQIIHLERYECWPSKIVRERIEYQWYGTVVFAFNCFIYI